MMPTRYAGDRQGSGGHPADQRLSRARPPDRGSRSAGRRAELSSPSSIRYLRADHLGSGSRVPHRHAWRRPSAKARKRCHAARDPRDAARRPTAARSACEYMHIQAGAEALAAAAHGAGGQQLAARRKTQLRILRQPDRGRRVRAFPALAASSGRSASRSKARRPRSPILDEIARARGRQQRARNRHRHGAPRTAERAGQHRRQAVGQIFSEFEGDIDPVQHAGLGRREVSPGRERRSHDSPAGSEIVVSRRAQSQPSGSRRSGGRRHRARRSRTGWATRSASA